MMKQIILYMACISAAALMSACAVGYDLERPALNPGGVRVNSLLYTPSGMEPGERRPGVVINHGGVRGAGRAIRGLAARLARAGFVVILPQFRGQGGSGGSFEFAEGEVKDSLAALSYLRGMEYVDENRVGMVGYGMGGLVTLLALPDAPGVRAVVLISPLSDPEAYMERMTAGALRDNPDQKKRHMGYAKLRSPIPALGGASSPVLILHGGDDREIPAAQSRVLYDAMVDAGVDADIKVYPGAGHDIISDDEARRDIMGYLEYRLR